MTAGVPIIDISAWFSGNKAARDQVAQNVARACEDWGRGPSSKKCAPMLSGEHIASKLKAVENVTKQPPRLSV